ncbi:hypothetical protein [Ramlibacter sp. Leaf400]|uniref:hypothetical protein n=1 Tax=Ramlibacter sp. Leaf400 TaxID=1736365 RepID=UPI0006FF0311|nr:hypothetical protein [Ramlibacter sp. Leaf400]KQT11484.1 hypothetical protein ASG30_06330 [Ramlibacter sp. Leaf400]
MAYLLHPNKVEVCQIDSDDLLINCVDAGGLAGHQDMAAIAVAGSDAYFSDFSGAGSPEVIHCSIGASGELSGCAVVGSFAGPYGLTIHGSTLYISDAGSPRITKCVIEPDGSLNACADALFPDALASTAENLQIVGTTAYVLHYDDAKVSRCEVGADGTLSGCADAGVPGLSDPEGLTIHGSHLYVANYAGDNVVRCVIAADGSGALNDCRDAGATGLSSPTHVAVRGSTVHITNSDPDSGLTRCTATSEGLLTSCTRVFSEPKSLYGIALR